ncbi:MAG: hypothetical protein AMDU5_GPLC00017G0032 [Thermoplasmatales archaeon Gpl]|nr:MAG: hypothetical protein AMDU5_GPLC00017G0032 [Thermoplasmatales archaeon Gpl]
MNSNRLIILARDFSLEMTISSCSFETCRTSGVSITIEVNCIDFKELCHIKTIIFDITVES